VSTFASSNSGLISINAALRDTYGIHNQPDVSGPVRVMAERIGRDLVSNAYLLSRNGIYEREVWTNRAAAALRMLTVRPFSRLRDVAEACRCNYDEAITLVAAFNRNRETARYLAKSGGDAPYRRSTSSQSSSPARSRLSSMAPIVILLQWGFIPVSPAGFLAVSVHARGENSTSRKTSFQGMTYSGNYSLKHHGTCRAGSICREVWSR
jgi:hypothetical protein